jgi:hypothetical protein
MRRRAGRAKLRLAADGGGAGQLIHDVMLDFSRPRFQRRATGGDSG